MTDVDVLSTWLVVLTTRLIQVSIRVVLAQSSTDSQEELLSTIRAIMFIHFMQSRSNKIDCTLKLWILCFNSVKVGLGAIHVVSFIQFEDLLYHFMKLSTPCTYFMIYDTMGGLEV